MRQVSINYSVNENGEIMLEMAGEYIRLLTGVAYMVDKLTSQSGDDLDKTFQNLKQCIKYVREKKEKRKDE